MGKRHLIAAVVALSMAATMYFGWTHFKTRYDNVSVDKQNSLLDTMETKGIPTFELVDTDGKSVSSDVIKGKVAFINFWASWCDPCVREFPSMLQLVDHFKGELILLAISNDEEKQDMLDFAKAFKAKRKNVYILWDPKREVSSQYGTEKLPETFMVGPDLKLIRKIIGVEKWYTDGSKRYLRDVIDSYKKPAS